MTPEEYYFIMNPPKPSLGFCITGWLQPGERYHQSTHSYGGLIRTRAPNIYNLYNMDMIERWVNANREFIDANLSNEQIAEIDELLAMAVVPPPAPLGQ